MTRSCPVIRDRFRLLAAAAVVLCAAAPAWAEGEGGKYGDLGQALTALAIFGGLLLILGKFAWKPVIAQLKRREQEVGERLRDAERRQNEAQDLEAHHRARLDLAEGEAKKLLDKSVEQAALAREELLAAAKEEGVRSIEAAKGEIERFKQDALAELQEAMADVAVDIAGQIIREELSPAKQQELVRESLERICEGAEKEGR